MRVEPTKKVGYYIYIYIYIYSTLLNKINFDWNSIKWIQFLSIVLDL